jgi:hypothetical protein
MAKSKTDAMGGGASLASLMARMNATPLKVDPASAVGTGSNHVMVRERGTPHSAGVDAGAPAGAGSPVDVDVDVGTCATPVTAHPLPHHMISSCNASYQHSFMTQLTSET